MAALLALQGPPPSARAGRPVHRRSIRLRVRADGDAEQSPASPLILPSTRKLELTGRSDLSPLGKVGGGEDFFRLPPGLRGLDPDDLPTQGRSVVEGNRGTAVQEREPAPTELDYLSVSGRAVDAFRIGCTSVSGNLVELCRAGDVIHVVPRATQELMAIQENGPRDIGFFGTRNMGFSHQSLIEILSYAMVLTARTALTFLLRP